MKKARSYSSLSLLAECPQKYAYSKGARLELPGTGMPLHTGSALHEALRILYRERWHYEDAREALREAWGDVKPPIGSPHPWRTWEFAEEVLKLYMKDREENPTILESGEPLTHLVEERTVFDWPNRHGEIVTVEGIPDLPLRVGRRHFVVDHKFTTGWINDWWLQKFRMGNQLRIYAAMMTAVEGHVFDAGLINAVYIGEKALDPPEKWEGRKSSFSLVHRLDFTPEQVEEAWRWVRGLQAQQEFHEREGFWPRDETSCSNWGGCEFLPLCTAPSEMARKSRMLTRYVRKEEQADGDTGD